MYTIPEAAYRCLILDYNKEFAKFRSVKNKRVICALNKYVHTSRRNPISGLR